MVQALNVMGKRCQSPAPPQKRGRQPLELGTAYACSGMIKGTLEQ